MDIEVDESAWPLVVVRWPASPVSDDDVRNLLAIGIRHLDRRVPFVAVHIGVTLTGLDARQRRMSADHVALHAEALGRYLRGTAIVTPNPVIRAIVRAIEWMSPAPNPQETFADVDEAMAWARQRLHGG